MKRALKWISGGLLFCVICFAGLIVVLPMLLDPNDYKDKISEIVYEQSGFRIEIPGEIRLNISPRLDVLFSLGQVQILSTPAFANVPLLNSEEVKVELSLLPLLREKRIAIKGLQLHGVYCHLIRDASGKGNWERAVVPVSTQKPSPVSPANSDQPATPVAKSSQSIPGFALGALDLSSVTVRYEDQRSGKSFELKDFSMQTDHVQDGQQFHLKSQFSLILSGNSNSTLTVENVLGVEVLFALSAKSLQLTNISLKSMVKAFGMEDAEFTVAGDAFIDLSKKNITIENFALGGGDLSIQLNAKVDDFSKPSFSGTLRVPEFSPDKFLKEYSIPQPVWKDSSALKQFGFSCEFSGNMKQIDISNITVLLDGTHGKGSFVLLDPSHPAYDFKMHFDRIDLDRYMTVAPKNSAVTAPAKNENKTTGNADNISAGATVSLQPLFPVEALRKLQFKLDLSVDSMKMKGAELSNVELKASGKDGRIALQPFRAELYEGTVSTNVNLDVSGSVPQLKITKNLDRVQVGPLLADMTGKEEVTGVAVLALKMTTKGNSREHLVRNSNGTMRLALEDGVIKKLHILQVVRQAKALYDKEPLVTNAKNEPTGFAHISASGVIKEGVFYNDDLKASSDLLKVTGAGNVNFAAEYVDYLLKVSVLSGMNRNEKSGKTDYSKFVVPYKIQGKISELKEEADVVGLFKEQAKTLLMGELQKQLNKSRDGSKQDGESSATQDLLQQGLKSLFGN